MGTRKNLFEIYIDILGTRPQRDSPTLTSTLFSLRFWYSLYYFPMPCWSARYHLSSPQLQKKAVWDFNLLQFFNFRIVYLTYSMEQSLRSEPPRLVKNFHAFYGTRMFITAFTSVRHLSLSWARSIQFMSPHSSSWRSILISSHLRLGLTRGLFPSGFPTYTPLLSPYVQHAPTISFFSIGNQNSVVRSTDH